MVYVTRHAQHGCHSRPENLNENPSNTLMKGGVRQSTSIGVDYHYGKIGVEPVELTGRWGGGVHVARKTPKVDLRTKYSWEDTHQGPILAPASIKLGCHLTGGLRFDTRPELLPNVITIHNESLLGSPRWRRQLPGF